MLSSEVVRVPYETILVSEGMAIIQQPLGRRARIGCGWCVDFDPVNQWLAVPEWLALQYRLEFERLRETESEQ